MLNYVVCIVETNDDGEGHVDQNIKYFYQRDSLKGNPMMDFNRLCPEWVGNTLEKHAQAFVKNPSTEYIRTKHKIEYKK